MTIVGSAGFADLGILEKTEFEMKQKAKFLFLLGIVNCQWSMVNSQEHVVPFSFGDMDHWVVREIHESGIIGGNTKHLYELGPTDTIIGNTAYTNRGGSPWANSNVMAKVAGVVKTNTSVFPERRDDGWCARLETRMESVKVFGLVDIEVVAAGSVFLGTVHEPIKGTKNPQAMLNSGVAFTKKPKALRFDYKVKLAPEKDRIRSTGFSRKTTVAGQDSIAVILLLQKRWEDKDGNIKGITGEDDIKDDSKSVSDNHFIIENKGNDDVKYLVTIEVSDNYKKYASVLLNPIYLRYNMVVNSTYIENKKFDNLLPIGTILENNTKITKETYVLYTGTLESGKTADVTLGIWLDYTDITNEYQESVFVGTITIYSETINKE
mgnify:CR=1 FL=1